LPKREELPKGVPSRFIRTPSLNATTFASWEEVSRVFAPLFATKDAIAPGSPLAAEVARIAGQSPDPLTRAALATRLVQDQVSYLMNGMNGGNYVPQAPAQTWASRYGDCKAKSLLLLSLLQALGIKAEVVMVNSSTGDAVAGSLPMPAAFDHVIVRAEIAGETYWLDGTATGTRLSTMADVPPFRTGLPLRADGAPLLAIVPRVPQVPLAIAKVVIDQRAGIDIPALVTVTSTFSGVLGSSMRAALGQASAEQKKQLIDSFADSMFNILSTNGGLVTDGDVGFDTETSTTTITVKGIVTTQFGSRDGSRRLDLSGLTSANESFDFDRSRASWKTLPVDLGPARRMREEVDVLLPADEPGFKLGGKADYEATYAGTTVTRKGLLDGQRLVVSEEHAALGGELPAADIPAERAKALRLKNTAPFLIAPVTAARAWRYQSAALKARLAPVEAAYAQAIARDPVAEQGAALVARAGLRAGTYDLEGAIADYDKAIAIEPEAANFAGRGALKRQLGRTDAAIEDLREALKLAPSADRAVALAAALGYAGKSEEALKLLTDYDDMGDEHSAVIAVRADVLGYAGKGTEGLGLIDGLIEEKPGDTALLNVSCWYRARFRVGADRMMQVCNEAVEKASSASQVLDSRAMAGIAGGNLAAALADADAALKLDPGQVPTQYVRAWIANAMGKPEAKADLAYFRKVMPGLVQEYARYGLK
jgi:tetratricopeptide (TPR) repeat protein